MELNEKDTQSPAYVQESRVVLANIHAGPRLESTEWRSGVPRPLPGHQTETPD